MHGARAGSAYHREGPLDHRRQLVGAQQGVAERGYVADDGTLVGNLVQPSLAESQLVALVDAGDHHHRHRVPVGLTHRSGDVGHAGARDDETGGGTAGRAREAVGHEARALLMAGRHVSNTGPRESAIELDGVHTGNAEDVIDSVRFQQLGENSAAGRHGRGTPPERWSKLRPRGLPAASGDIDSSRNLSRCPG